MKIAIAGPYSADTEQKRQENLDRLNQVAAEIVKLGHIPLVGINAALPVIQKLNTQDSYNVIMDISLAVVESCDALLLVAESAGANRERDLVRSQNKPIFHSMEELINFYP